MRRERFPVVQKDFGPGLTRQSMKDECDVNRIMKRFLKTGVISHANRFAGEYGFASSISFREAMDVVARATEMFEALPAKVRSRFGHDPGAFLDFVRDPKNLDAMRELGLAKPAPEAPAKSTDEKILEELQKRPLAAGTVGS